MKADYASKGVKFYFVYKSLAHPEGGSKSYVAPVTLNERLTHIKTAYKELGNTIPWLCDNMQNDFKHKLGDRPNSEFIVDPKGEIVAMRDWSNPESLREELEKLVGKSETVTRISDLNLKIESKPSTIKKGIVERPSVPQGMKALKVVAQESKSPFYVKLRCEADNAALNGRDGKVYLGFHLDPIHHVHWNNLAPPLEYEIVGFSEGKLTPSAGKAAKIAAESDIDPREFVLDSSKLESGEFKVKVRYFACSDDEGWCKAVSQEYVVTLEVDRDGGSARRSGGRPGAGQRGQPGMRRGQGMQPRNGQRGGQGAREFSAENFFRNDKNEDGKVTRDELPSQMLRMFERIDSNGDGAITKAEAKQVEERMKRRG